MLERGARIQRGWRGGPHPAALLVPYKEPEPKTGPRVLGQECPGGCRVCPNRSVWVLFGGPEGLVFSLAELSSLKARPGGKALAHR